MFTNCKTTIAVTDLDRARNFYGKKLGLREVGKELPEGDAVFACGDKQLYLYQRSEPAGSTATVCNFEADDLEKTVMDMRNNGIRFEEYDTPDLKTQNGLAEMGDFKVGWFKDPDGNILAVSNEVKVSPEGATIEARTR